MIQLATKTILSGIPKFTPSQVVTQTIGAMDDKLDERRPQFSTSAEVGAVAMIIVVSRYVSQFEHLKTAIDLLVEFFGGENGLFTKGFQKR